MLWRRIADDNLILYTDDMLQEDKYILTGVVDL